MKAYLRWLGCLVTAFAALVFAGCGGGGTGGTGTEAGAAVVGLTDAAGDFFKYEVNVVSIQLTRADGSEVETLPLNARIDFAQLTDLTEFVRASTVPGGRYVEATLNLDYTGADIVADDGTGAGKAVGSFVGTDGQPLPVPFPIKVELDGGHPFVVAPGVTRYLTLDFNLAATNHLDLGQDPAVLTVDPVLSADVSHDVPKFHRVRGPLQSVDTAGGTFVVALRPFRATADFGRFTVSTDAETLFTVGGQSAKGATGLALLSVQPALTAVVAVGDFVAGTDQFLAWKVLSGSAEALDMVRGVVVGRAGDVLTVKGTALDRETGTLTLDEEFRVSVGPETGVTRQVRDVGTLDKDDISVGQRIFVAGAVAGQQVDATRGRVRLLVTPVSGIVHDKPVGGGLVLGLQHLAGRRPGLFDFAGTGTTSAADADPQNYEVDTGALPLEGLGSGEPVRALGFVTRFGAAPPDFAAETLVALGNVPATLAVIWTPPTASAFTHAPDTELALGLDAGGALHHVFRRGVATELLGSPAPRIVPAADGTGVFSFRVRKVVGRPVTAALRFDAFAAALKAALDGGAAVASLSATGTFDDETQTLTARKIFVQLRGAQP